MSAIEDLFIEKAADRTADTIKHLKSLSLEEYILKIKWWEIQKHAKKVDTFRVAKARIFNPTTIKEIEDLQIEIIHVNPIPDLFKVYKAFMIFTSSALQNNYPGRKQSFLIVTKNHDYIGMVTVAGDIGALSGRDKMIGWSADNKYKSRKINCLANAQVLVPLQPFGFNCLGGKLLARIVVTDYFRKMWKDVYGDTVVGMTTTSLYGSYSQYTGLKFWKDAGVTSGKIPIELPDYILDDWKAKYPRPKNDKDVAKARYKTSLMQNICKDLGIDFKTVMHGIRRGVHYTSLYENSNEYLQCKIGEEKLIPIPKLNELDFQVSEWKKAAIKRMITLQKDGRFKSKESYYDEAVNLDFDDTKKLFLPNINR